MTPWFHEHQTSKAARLLVVDDNARTRQALVAYLSALEGFQVVGQACDGQDAIEKLKIQAADVVLMDCMMRRLTGVEATRLIKQHWPGIKVVILTIYPDCQVAARAAGADAVLLKGCSMEELESTIRTVGLA